MPRSSKANLPWIDHVGEKIAADLSERYARPMIFRQSGPYTQSKTPHVGVFFSDPVFHHIDSVKPNHKVDFRFGFCLERGFSEQDDAHTLVAGFMVRNPTLSARFFMPNIRKNSQMLATRLSAWLRRHGGNAGRIRFALGAEEQYLGFGEVEHSELENALTIHADARKIGANAPWRRYYFSAFVLLSKYTGRSEIDLMNAADDLAASGLSVFKQLDFLYCLLFPNDIGPSRLSGGQNRALKAKQPDERCAWLNNEHCQGAVNAAHIKPDRLGGLAVARNLVWLCQFHHNLVDSYLKSEMWIDHASKKVMAKVRRFAPPDANSGSMAFSIWTSIG